MGTDTQLGSATNDLKDYQGCGGLLSSGRVEASGVGTAEFLIELVETGYDGTSKNQLIRIRRQGKSTGRAGATITNGQRLQTGATALWEPATTTESAVAIALQDASSGDKFKLAMDSAGRPYPEA